MSRDKLARRARKHNLAGYAAHASSADVEAAQQYWDALDVEERMLVLRFEDPRIMRKIISVQEDLCQSDFECFKLGLRGMDSIRSKIGMHQFTVECDSDLRPAAFCAKDELVQRHDFFEFVESQLGRPFLKGRQILQRGDWPSLLEPTASSWSSFMCQMLGLVEMALFHAMHDASHSFKGNPVNAVEKDSEQDSKATATDKQPASMGRSAKRRMKKKLNASVPQPTQEIGDINEKPTSVKFSDSPGNSANLGAPISTPENSCLQAAPQEKMTKVCSTFDDVGEFGKTPKTSGAASSTEPDSYLKFDWSTEGPPIDAAVESAVELHMDWSADGPRPDETRWSAWLPNGLTGSAAEWYWVSTDRQMRAFVKNTFLDEEDASRTDDRPARARSLPAKITYAS